MSTRYILVASGLEGAPGVVVREHRCLEDLLLQWGDVQDNAEMQAFVYWVDPDTGDAWKVPVPRLAEWCAVAS